MNSYIKINVVILIILSSCNTSSLNSPSGAKSNPDSLAQENERLKKRLAEIEMNSNSQSTRNRGIAEGPSSENLPVTSNSDYYENYGTKYAFVLLTTTKYELDIDQHQKDLKTEQELHITIPKKGFVLRQYYIASSIKEFRDFNEDIEYKYMDDVQSEFSKQDKLLNSELSHITSRKCLSFDTYSEASKERSKYITGQ